MWTTLHWIQIQKYKHLCTATNTNKILERQTLQHVCISVNPFAHPFSSTSGRKVKYFQRNTLDSIILIACATVDKWKILFSKSESTYNDMHVCLLSLLLVSWRTWWARALPRVMCRSDRKLKSIAIVSIQVDTLEETDGA